MTDTLPIRIASLHLHPVKSCAVLDVAEALLVETGFDLDRQWMVVDAQGEFISQREQPRLALVRCQRRAADLVLRAPGMLALHIALDAAEEPCSVQVWDDRLPAYDMGALAAQWFSDFLGVTARLARFDPEQRRLSSPKWSAGVEALNQFSDGFPILVASVGGLEQFNQRLAAQGASGPVTMARFRPNIVIDADDAALREHLEDHLDELRFGTEDAPVRLKLVKPCARCPIPDVEPGTGVADPARAVTAALASYRADARLDGALTFGMNAVILEGVERVLRVGDVGQATLAF
ncbi:MOSC domain-containing protein [Rivibacter subsaxonicus]|uniref:MOSC domain-containing protein n=1 Tax=Rivibacter subsaxonicus TaxID=457575 RepID=A0A4Q7VGS3_9BURK|nr:MOSC N-terminal beta barrel domain-containing protein [Rivibacter subsaxonicus]RZT95214.1 hypothetical protein EV670_2965 [Rivibacter subsaxonicus]